MFFYACDTGFTHFALLVTSLAFGQESCPNMHDSNSWNNYRRLLVVGFLEMSMRTLMVIWDSQDDCIEMVVLTLSVYPSLLGQNGGFAVRAMNLHLRSRCTW